jgi:hypothetical protein
VTGGPERYAYINVEHEVRNDSTLMDFVLVWFRTYNAPCASQAFRSSPSTAVGSGQGWSLHYTHPRAPQLVPQAVLSSSTLLEA